MKIQDAIDLLCEKEPLFISLVLALKPVEDNQGCPTLGTDGEHLFYNTRFLESLSEEETCGVILHEVLHCAFAHMWRRDEREPSKWNQATDYAINPIVTESFMLPQGSLLNMKYYGMSAEEIYDDLPDSKDKKGKGKNGDGDGDGEQTWCEKKDWEPGGEGGKKESLMDKLKGKKRSKMTAEEKAEKWQRLFEQAMVQNYGKMPDSVKRLIDKSYYVPVIDWAALVSNLLSEDESDYTFASPDRRFMESDFMLPGMYSEDKLKDVIFAYDTSGSISQDDLRAFYHETMKLFENFSNLTGWVGVCDAYLHSFVEANPQQGFDDFNFQGGGGTAFEPVFDEIKKRNLKPKAVFYFTDTYGSFPHEEPEYPVFWLVRSQIGEDYQLDVPFGRVIRFLSN